MILITKTSQHTRPRGHNLSTCTILTCVFVCVCVCVFTELHITAQSDSVALVNLCHSH